MRAWWQLGVLGSAWLAACAGGPDAAPGPVADRIDSAGVEIVINPGADRALPWRFEVVEEIAGGEVDTLLQAGWQAVRVGASADGRLWIGDLSFGHGRLFRVEPGSGALVPVGRNGGGPGEYELPGAMAVAPSGEVAVVDFGKQALVRFAPDASPLPELRWQAFGDGMPGLVAYVPGGFVVHMTSREDSTTVGRLVLATPVASELVRLAEPSVRDVLYDSCRVVFAQAPLFSPELTWAAGDSGVVWAAGTGYDLAVWRDGRVVRRIRRDLPPRVATRELARQQVGEGQRIGFDDRPACTIPPDEVLEKRGYQPTIPAIAQVAMTGDGSLWVRRLTVTGEMPLLDVFDPTGAYVGTVAGSYPWPQAWLPGGDLVAVMPDSSELPVVMRYRVVEDRE